MMKCRDITLVASDYIDGRLRWRKRMAVAFHLMMCTRCRHFMTGFRSASRVLRGYTPEPPDPSQIERFDRAVDGALDHHCSDESHRH